GIGNIGLQHEGAAACLFYFALGCFEAIEATRDQADPGSALGEFAYGGASDAGGCASDDDNFGHTHYPFFIVSISRSKPTPEIQRDGATNKNQNPPRRHGDTEKNREKPVPVGTG